MTSASYKVADKPRSFCDWLCCVNVEEEEKARHARQLTRYEIDFTIMERAKSAFNEQKSPAKKKE